MGFFDKLDKKAASLLLKRVMQKNQTVELWLLNDLAEDDFNRFDLPDAIRFFKKVNGNFRGYRFTRFLLGFNDNVECRIQPILEDGFGEESEWFDITEFSSESVDPKSFRILDLAKWIEKNVGICLQVSATNRQRIADEERQHLEAEEAEKNRIAEEERLRQEAEEAEKRRIAEEERLRQETEEAEKRRIAEEGRLRQEAEEAEKKRIAEEERQRREAEEAEKKRIAEEERQRKIAKKNERKRLYDESSRRSKFENDERQILMKDANIQESIKTLFISLSNDFPLDNGGNNVIVKYNLLNDILYEIGAELTFKFKDVHISDKTKIITDIKDYRPEDYKIILERINSEIILRLLMPEIPEETCLTVPSSYTDWLVYHSNQIYAEIGRKLREEDNTITLCLKDIYDEYIKENLIRKIKNLINSDTRIQKFTIVELNDSKSGLVKLIESLRDNLEFDRYDGAWVQAGIGYAFYAGAGTPKDLKKSLIHYKNASEKGNGSAANWVGWCYEQGIGTESDSSKALFWYNRGADLGNHFAEANAAFFYNNGIGTEVDIAKAEQLYLKATACNIPFAIHDLGDIYYYGKNGSIDLERAFKYFSTNASNNKNQPFSEYYTGYMLMNGSGVKKDERKALEYLLCASNNGNKDAYYYTGKLIMAGYGDNTKNAKSIAKTYFRLGTEAGNDMSAVEYARLLIEERNNIRNNDEIIVSLTMAIDKGNIDAMYELSLYQYHNRKFTKDLDPRYNYYTLLTKLVSLGYSNAYELLAKFDEIKAKQNYKQEREREREREKEREEEERIKRRIEAVAALKRRKEQERKIIEQKQ